MELFTRAVHGFSSSLEYLSMLFNTVGIDLHGYQTFEM